MLTSPSAVVIVLAADVVTGLLVRRTRYGGVVENKRLWRFWGSNTMTNNPSLIDTNKDTASMFLLPSSRSNRDSMSWEVDRGKRGVQ